MHFTSGILFFLFIFVYCCGTSSILEGTAIIAELKNDIVEGWNKSSEFFHKEAKNADKNLQVLKNSISEGLNKSAQFLHKETEAGKVQFQILSKNLAKGWNNTKRFFEKQSRDVKEYNNILEDKIIHYPQAVFQKAKKAFEDEVEEVSSALEGGWNASDSGCLCEHYTCGCCSHLELAEIELNATICANVTYLVKDYGVSFTVTVNKYTIYNETISARNPPPVCTGMPFVKELAEICIRLYNIDATTTYLHACARVEARMKKILVAKYELGCFTLGPPGINKHSSIIPKEDIVSKLIMLKQSLAQTISEQKLIMLKQSLAQSIIEQDDDISKERMPATTYDGIVAKEIFIFFVGGMFILMLIGLIVKANNKVTYDTSYETDKLLI